MAAYNFADKVVGRSVQNAVSTRRLCSPPPLSDHVSQQTERMRYILCELFSFPCFRNEMNPNSVSQEQIDFCRLLVKCESLLSQPKHEWRITKFINALNDRLNRLSSSNVLKPSDEQLQEFTKKVNFLKGVLQVERLETSSQKLMATQLLSPGLSPCLDQKVHSQTKDIYMQSQTKYTNEMRSELLGTESESRITGKSGTDDVDAVLRHHHAVQERVAEEMIALTRNLKENALMANHIIKKDTECLQKTGELAGKNFENLRQSSDVISDFVKRSCQYWVWIMLALVCLTFLWMVVFIRIFPKKY